MSTRGHHALLLGAAPAGPVVTWNPLDKSANVNLSAGNLNAQCATAANSLVRATQGRSTGKWYFELLAVQVRTTALAYIIGIANSGLATNNFVGATSLSCGWRSAGGFLTSGGASGSATFTSGDILGIAYDHSTKTTSFYKNNVLQGSRAYPGSATTVYPAISFNNAMTQNGTARFRLVDFTYAPPTGYSPWE